MPSPTVCPLDGPQITLTHDTWINIEVETGTLQILVKKGTRLIEYNWEEGPDENGMVWVSFPLHFGDTLATFTGKVSEKLLHIDWDGFCPK